MVVQFLPVEYEELDDTAEYYETRSPGLGRTFRREVQRATDLIARHPEAWQAVEGTNARRFVTDRFPYLIVYEVKNDVIWILAVAHGSREPGYWTDRVR